MRKPRPPAVIIEEPTEEELNALLTKPVESDNSSPGAEVNPQVIYFRHKYQYSIVSLSTSEDLSSFSFSGHY